MYSSTSRHVQPIDASPELVARVDMSRGVLELAGELHRRTVHLLHDAVTTLLLTERRCWQLHVGNLLIWDTRGLRALAGAHRRALAHERQMTIVGASPQLRRTLELLRLDQLPDRPGDS